MPEEQSSISSFTMQDAGCRICLVAGPWSSGTSAVTGILFHLGLLTPGPFVKVNDPLTPDTYEMEGFRKLMLELCCELTLAKKRNPSHTQTLLHSFFGNLKKSLSRNADPYDYVVLKHPLSIMYLGDLRALLDTRIIAVFRSLKEIESTRLRRGWHESFGQRGAKKLYDIMAEEISVNSLNVHIVFYENIKKNPNLEIDKIIEFLGVEVSEECRARARASIRH